MAGISPGDDPSVVATELDWIGTMAVETGLTATFIVLQHNQDPTRWRTEAPAERVGGAFLVLGMLNGADVLCGRTLRPLDDLELDPLPFAQALEPRAADRGVVYEDVFRPVVKTDEAESLRVVEPLHRSLCHLTASLL